MKNRIRNQLLPFAGRAKVERIIVACSGGADSVALTAILVALAQELCWQITVAHFNHGVRGAEAERDANFVQELAEKFAVPFVCEKMSWQKRRFSEERAREARYQFLARTATQHQARWVALGHNKDDVVETMLINLLRGTGITGLKGIPLLREDLFLRPLRNFSRAEILSFLRQEQLPFVEDATNQDTRFLRNRIRHELLPLLEQKYNPQTRRHLLQLADISSQVHDFLEQEATHALYGIVAQNVPTGNLWRIPLAPLRSLHPAIKTIVLKKMMKLVVKDTEISHEHIQLLHRLVAGRQGSQEISLPRSLKIRREYDELIFIAPHQRNIPQSVGCDEEVVLPPAETTPQYLAISAMLFRFSLVPAIVARFDNRAITFLDVNKIAPPFFFRRWHVGDRMNPLGMNNQSRKVQDIFTDKKIPRQERQLLPLLHDQAGILWIPNIALSERARVTEQSQELLKIEIMRSDDTV